MPKGKRVIREYREVVSPPERFEDGFSRKTIIIGIIMIAVMMPSLIYLNLMTGIESAMGEWWVVFLAAALARGSSVKFKRQEFYLLLYITGIASLPGAFDQLIWRQYFIQSPQALQFQIADKVPFWAIPPPNSEALATRSLIHEDWLIPIIVAVAIYILRRVGSIASGYALFKATSDMERLPFPMALVATEGVTALTEVAERKEDWRWRSLWIGGVFGLGFGAIYIGIPAITGVTMSRPLKLLPIPLIDLTSALESIFPTAAIGISTNLSLLFLGFVLPFPVVAGAFLASMLTQLIINPFILYPTKLLHSWHPGDDIRATVLNNNIDFWQSFRTGMPLAIACIGAVLLSKHLYLRFMKERTQRPQSTPSEGRGDFPIWLALGIWGIVALIYVIICRRLVSGFPLIFLVSAAFIWSPLNSYITARMFGLTGRPFPTMLRSKEFIVLSRYREIDIWFAPFPSDDYGKHTQRFRELELTGTRFTSIIKAEVVMVPIALICGLLVWQFIWKLAPIPSAVYPHAQVTWPMEVTSKCVWVTSLRDGQSHLLRAIRPRYILAGFGTGAGLYGLTMLARISSLWFYGFVLGLGNTPSNFIPMFAGAALGLWCKRRFDREYKEKRWMKMAPLLYLGFTAGTGIVGIGTVIFAVVPKLFIAKPF